MIAPLAFASKSFKIKRNASGPLRLGILITLSENRPFPFPKFPPPNNTCNAGATNFPALIDIPWKPISAILCCPQAFIQPLILIVIS